jgi:ribosome maturation factor RimP
MAMAPAGQVDTPEFLARLHELTEPVVRSEGLVLVELIWRREGRGRVLRLYVDRPEGGVTLDECAMVSRQISHLLDVEDFIPGKYSLEVSSPGLTRQLKNPREYDVFAGRPARIVIRDADGRTETVKGVLKGLAGEEVLIETKGRVRSVPLCQVAKAKLEV